ncbi:MAG: dihydroneopterin aldolase [Bacteroidaceae bacterium]|nr:dihydroneopterin aldolase [Bacteroidaceae bacterium]MBR2863331.1 dihydroneopterin aldolase [Bacteroidaceae bacterium]
MKNLKLSITLENLKFYAYHGVLEQERKVGGEYTVNISLEVTKPDCAVFNDSLEGTVNYATIYQLIKMEMQQPSALLEHVAGRILEKIFTTFASVEHIEIKLCKLNPPMGAAGDGACVMLCADR